MQENQLEHINNQAREWFTLMQSGSASELEKQALQEWLHENRAHQLAYDDYATIWQDLGHLHEQERAALKRSVNVSVIESIVNFVSNFMSGFRALALKPQTGITFTVMGVLVAAVVFFTLQPEKIVAQNFSTTIGEVKKILLEDGSEITLGARSELKTWATAKERHVVLATGQAFFKIAKNPQRPFLVEAGTTKIRVLGTQFDVRRGSDRTRVAVQEGVVDVSGTNKNVKPVVLTAQQQVTHFNSGVFDAVNKISVSELESWRNGRLIYLSANLADVVADANRYFNTSIRLGSKDLATVKVTAAVSTNNIDSLTDMLTSSLSVKLVRDAQNNIVIVPNK